MIGLGFGTGTRELRVLALGAHADDIEIGAGATLLRLQQQRPVVVLGVVFSATDVRRAEAEHSASMLFDDAHESSLDVLDFDENTFPTQFAGLKSAMADLRSFEPDVVFSHWLHDRHQDHRTIAELTWQAFRDHLVVQYEIPKWEGDLGTPNAYVSFDDATMDRKISVIEQAFTTQADKPWFDAETFRGLARIRGLECGQRWAEGFHIDKLTLDVEDAQN